MARSLDQIQDGILEYLSEYLNEPLVEQAIPDINTVRRNPTTKTIEPYVAIQFGDLQQGRRYNMATPMGDDYILPVYTQAIAKDARTARKISTRLMMGFLAHEFPWSGSVRKRSGGNMWPLVNSNSATEAFSFPGSYGLLVQLSNEA